MDKFVDIALNTNLRWVVAVDMVGLVLFGPIYAIELFVQMCKFAIEEMWRAMVGLVLFGPIYAIELFVQMCKFAIEEMWRLSVDVAVLILFAPTYAFEHFFAAVQSHH